MLSLFSSFDLFFFYMPYMIFVGIVLILSKLTYKNNYRAHLFSVLAGFLYSISFSGSKNQSWLALPMWMSIFSLAFFFNYYSIWPYVYSLTSHPGYVLCASLTLWGMINVRSFAHRFKGGLSHFIPNGCPLALAPFLFLIEIVSTCIRPLTLMVRLCANILAGHLLMILLSKLALISVTLTGIYILLNCVEFFVSVVQAYIFVTLLTLYYSESC